jgi:hypothetical protein
MQQAHASMSHKTQDVHERLNRQTNYNGQDETGTGTGAGTGTGKGTGTETERKHIRIRRRTAHTYKAYTRIRHTPQT